MKGRQVADNNGWKPESAAFEVVGQRDGQWVVKIREGYRPNDVLRYFIDHGKGITSFTEILPSLSDIFIRLVEGTPLARQFQPVNTCEMRKMWLITRREYLTRVRNKTFLLSTFLLPLVFILFISGAVLIQLKTKSHNRIAVIDANGYFKDYLKGDSTLSFDFSPGIDTLNYEQQGCTAVLIIPRLADSGKTECRLKYKKALGLEQASALDDRIRDAVTDHMIFEKTTVSRAKLDSIRSESDIAHISSFEDNGQTARASSQTSAYVIGYVSGILIYLLTFIYGAAVMRGVMEEKTNRIAEVMVSSVRPFELMWGKITGIGAVGLTQFLLWIVLLGAIGFIAQGILPHDALENASQECANEWRNGCRSSRSGKSPIFGLQFKHLYY